MTRLALLNSMLVLALATSACNSDDGSTCETSSDCPSGNVCFAERCELLCSASEPCPAGFVCDLDVLGDTGAGVCIDDERAMPRIRGVEGNGSTACQSITSASCIGDGFIARGAFPQNTSFELIGPGEATTITQYPLEVVSRDPGGSVVELAADLTGNPAVTPGRYTLVARNQAGSDDADIQLLQGEPGPNLTGDELIERINTASTELIASERLDVEGGSGGGGGVLYRYDDSTTPATGEPVGDRMWVRVKGSDDGSPRSLPIDHERFSALCGDGDGCSVTLGAERLRVDHDLDPETQMLVLPALGNGGACKLFFEPESGAWTIENSCYQRRQRLERTGTDTYEDDGAFRPYAPAVSLGFDNDGARSPVIAFSLACYFADAPPSDTEPGYAPDDADGFHLILAGADWADYPTDIFPTSDAERSCVLIIED